MPVEIFPDILSYPFQQNRIFGLLLLESSATWGLIRLEKLNQHLGYRIFFISIEGDSIMAPRIGQATKDPICFLRINPLLDFWSNMKSASPHELRKVLRLDNPGIEQYETSQVSCASASCNSDSWYPERIPRIIPIPLPKSKTNYEKVSHLDRTLSQA